MKNLIVLLFVGLAGTSCLGVVAAQELLAVPVTGDFGDSDFGDSDIGDNVPDLAMPPMPDPALEGDQQGVEEFSVEDFSDENFSDEIIGDGGYSEPHEDSWELGEYAEQFEPYFSDDYQMFQHNEPVLESTGTWIRRGFWYAEVDAVIFKRKFNRDPLVLAQQPVGFSSSIIQPGSQIHNQLLLNGSKPGAEGVPRFTLGHFLFRDHHNRDHVGELTVYGGAEWTQQAQLDVNLNNDLGSSLLIVPTVVDGGNASFDGATSSNFRYDSRFNSFELNYHVKERLGHDHLEMEPSGHWVRRAGPSISRSLLAGIRFFDLNEDFAWDASGIDFDNNVATPADAGNVRIHTDNDMIGTQLGFTWTYETARWSGGVRAKGGMYLNLIDVRSSSIIPTPTDSIVSDSALEAEELGFIGETSFVGKWHLRPNFSLRAGAELLFITSTALAPAQITGSFLPSGPISISTSGDPIYLGGSIGFEGYW